MAEEIHDLRSFVDRLDPSQPRTSTGFSDKMIIDATWLSTPDYPPREEWGGATHPPLIATSPELLKYIESRCAEYGIGRL